ncbi:gas vesicle protein [Halobacillus fulvus]|nr:gas vesicle protein [Halobacillus fulvus]
MSYREQYENNDVALIDILDAVLEKGVVICGDLVISIAGIDLVYLDVRILISAVETLMQHKQEAVSSDRMDQEKEAMSRVIR